MEIKVLASGSTGNAYTISDGRTTLLLDAGIPMSQIRVSTGFNVSRIDGALITHEHGDHIKAARDLMRAGVDVYASAGTLKAQALIGHRAHPVRSRERFDVGTFKVVPFDVQHDAAEPLGFTCESRITGEKLLYATDTYYIKYRFTDLTHIMIECNYSEEGVRHSVEAGYIPQELVPRLIKSHMSLEHLLEMLRANDLSKVQRIYLLHLSSNNSDEEAFRTAVARETGAEVYVC